MSNEAERVSRYDASTYFEPTYGCDIPDMVQSDNGDWVRFADYEALAKRVEELEAAAPSVD